MKSMSIILSLIVISASLAYGKVPPRESRAACEGKPENSPCSFISPKGQERGTCVYTPDRKYFACRPERGDRPGEKPGPGRDRGAGQKYSIEQAVSDSAQLNTISFAALSFMSSGLCEISFLPPGKHASYFGFQYMRDVRGGAAGHGQNFVPRTANIMLSILSAPQRQMLIDLAVQQKDKIKEFALMRFPLLVSISDYAGGTLPAGKTRLSRDKIVSHSGSLYALDGELSYERAQGFGKVIDTLTRAQESELAGLKELPYDRWPDKGEQLDKRRFDHDIHVAVMTYASELFSWITGDLEKDVYFTPERTAAYFGAYWTKAAPMKAVRTKDYQISTALTGDSGARFLEMLDKGQRSLITGLVRQQKPYLTEMVDIRRGIASELRKIAKGKTADREKVMALSRRFGELDGEITFLYADAFTRIRQSLTASQANDAVRLRNISQYPCRGAYIYAEPSSVPETGDISMFFQ